MAVSSRSSFSPAVARWLARELDIPPSLTIAAGNRGVRAMMALKRAADAGDGPLRADYVIQAQKEIAGLDPTRNGALVQHLQGCVVALGGRGSDTELAHVTPGETIIPDPLM